LQQYVLQHIVCSLLTWTIFGAKQVLDLCGKAVKVILLFLIS
jgi:uncharacterized membrane protein YeiB